VSYPPAAPVQYAYPSPPAAPPPGKKKRGCCSCCLWLVLIVMILSVSFIVAAQFIMRTPANPVKEEYESIPDYFSHLDPGIRGNESGNQEIRKEVSNPQSAIRDPHLEYGTQELRKEVFNSQFAIRNSQLTQLSGGAHV
jgi:hypothetical protein